VTNCWFSNLCLWTSRECAYCVAIMLICLELCILYLCNREFFLISRLFIDAMCMVALPSDVKIMSGATFHPLVLMLVMSNQLLCVFLVRAFATNLSLQYVNYVNCIVSHSIGALGGGWSYW
jgi:hypothetical protein